MIDLTGIKHFTLSAILTAGSVDYKIEEIPEELHANFRPTIVILDKLRDTFDIPIALNCTYRSPEHNLKCKGEKNSLHLLFNAIDFHPMCSNMKDTLQKMYNQLNYWDKVRFFNFLPKTGSMGIGIYDHFLHLDTRALMYIPKTKIKYNAPARWDER